jgi:hypothetical protein
MAAILVDQINQPLPRFGLSKAANLGVGTSPSEASRAMITLSDALKSVRLSEFMEQEKAPVWAR